MGKHEVLILTTLLLINQVAPTAVSETERVYFRAPNNQIKESKVEKAEQRHYFSNEGEIYLSTSYAHISVTINLEDVTRIIDNAC